jgi:hypothetical protein
MAGCRESLGEEQWILMNVVPRPARREGIDQRRPVAGGYASRHVAWLARSGIALSWLHLDRCLS